jgi:3-mercaptopyruvate sulfurtransferase SseA
MDNLEAGEGWSAIDAAAILLDRAHAEGTSCHIPGMVLMDIAAALPIVVKGRLVNMLEVTQMERDFIR